MHSFRSNNIVKITPTNILIVIVKQTHHVGVLESMVAHPNGGIDDYSNQNQNWKTDHRPRN